MEFHVWDRTERAEKKEEWNLNILENWSFYCLEKVYHLPFSQTFWFINFSHFSFRRYVLNLMDK